MSCYSTRSTWSEASFRRSGPGSSVSAQSCIKPVDWPPMRTPSHVLMTNPVVPKISSTLNDRPYN